MMKRYWITAKLLVLLLILTSCTSFETRDGLYREAEPEVADVEVEDEAVLDEVAIFDEEIALAGDPMVDGFDLSTFTNVGDLFVEKLKKDVEANLSEDRDYRYYQMVSQVPRDDLMAVVNVDLEHMMQFDEGNWEDRRTEYSNGQGHTISTFRADGGYYSYDIRYNDNDGAYRIVKVRYDSVLERYDSSSESYNPEGIFSYAVRQQFCSDGEGGYYYQAVRQSLADSVERISFSHFDGEGYTTYIRPAMEKVLIESFEANLYEEIPVSIGAMLGDYPDLIRFVHQEGEFRFTPVQ